MATILVAGNDEVLCPLIEESLDREGHRVLPAGDGKQALFLMREQSVDLGILEYELPLMTVQQLLVELKRGKAVIPPTIIISASCSSRRIMECAKAGARDFVVKPFELPFLLQRVARLLRENGTIQPDIVSQPTLAHA